MRIRQLTSWKLKRSIELPYAGGWTTYVTLPCFPRDHLAFGGRPFLPPSSTSAASGKTLTSTGITAKGATQKCVGSSTLQPQPSHPLSTVYKEGGYNHNRSTEPLMPFTTLGSAYCLGSRERIKKMICDPTLFGFSRRRHVVFPN